MVNLDDAKLFVEPKETPLSLCLSFIGGCIIVCWIAFIVVVGLNIKRKLKKIIFVAATLLLVFPSLQQQAKAGYYAYPYDAFVNVLVLYDEEFPPDKLDFIAYNVRHCNKFSTIDIECFEGTFGIHFEIVGYMQWDSNDNYHYVGLLIWEAINDIGWHYGFRYNNKKVHVLLIVTGQSINDCYAAASPDYNVTIFQYPLIYPSIMRHELSHLFLCPDCNDPLCVMNPNTAKGGKIMRWCDKCKQVILANKYRYGKIEWGMCGGGGLSISQLIPQPSTLA